MIAFPGMLAAHAASAGMKVPTDPDAEDWNPEEFPHFHVFCSMQLGKALHNWDEPDRNAKLIAAIPQEKIRKVSWLDLVQMGFE